MAAFFFDIDDTLYDLCQPYMRAVHETFDGRYDSLIDLLFVRSRVYSDSLFRDYCSGLMSEEEYYLLRNQKAFLDCSISINNETARTIDTLYKQFQKEIALSKTIRELLLTLMEFGVV